MSYIYFLLALKCGQVVEGSSQNQTPHGTLLVRRQHGHSCHIVFSLNEKDSWRACWETLESLSFNEVRPQSQGSRGENETLEQPSSPEALLDMVRASFSILHMYFCVCVFGESDWLLGELRSQHNNVSRNIQRLSHADCFSCVRHDREHMSVCLCVRVPVIMNWCFVAGCRALIHQLAIQGKFTV